MEEHNEQLRNRLMALMGVLAISDKRDRLAELTLEAGSSSLWDDQANAVAVLAEQKQLSELLVKWEDTMGLLELEGLSESDYANLERDVQYFERLALLSGKHDDTSVVLTIHAGTGGVDAQDWAEMLERMFLRYIEQGRTEEESDRALAISRTNWSATVLERSPAEEAGIKSVVIEVRGTMAYGLLKGEAGVHRLVRLSPFNAKNLRQTSFALVEVIPEIDQSQSSTIPESDLRIDVYRSGGAGGQHVNTTDSAVRITHLPTGIVVAIQNERSQQQNKATAMKVLQSKLLRLQELKNAEEVARLKGEFKEGTWGNQIRSYVMQPYQMVKDHRTDHETANIQSVLNGDLKGFIEAELIQQVA